MMVFFLLSIGSELSENPLKKKMSIDQLIEKYPEKNGFTIPTVNK